jgi:hypothetical protein
MTTQQVYAENYFFAMSAVQFNPVIPMEGIHALSCFLHSPSIQIRLRGPIGLSTLIMYAYLPHDNPASLCRKLFVQCQHYSLTLSYPWRAYMHWHVTFFEKRPMKLISLTRPIVNDNLKQIYQSTVLTLFYQYNSYTSDQILALPWRGVLSAASPVKALP